MSQRRVGRPTKPFDALTKGGKMARNRRAMEREIRDELRATAVRLSDLFSDERAYAVPKRLPKMDDDWWDE